MPKKYSCSSLAGLKTIGEKLLDSYKERRIFAFYGEMGAGKTTFIKTLCTLLGATDTVSSPSFSIINEYITDSKDIIFHFDLYRIKSWTELLDLGYEEYFFSGNYCLLEWPEKIVNLLPEETVTIRIEVTANGTKRSFYF